MIDDPEDLATAACVVFALVCGVFVGKLTTDKRLVRECCRAEAEEKGIER
jgi:hypothetical protein